MAFSDNYPQQEKAVELRRQAEKAIEELRYRDALTALDQIAREGQATFEDKDRTLFVLVKLRENEEFDARLKKYISEEQDSFNKGRFCWRELKRYEERNRWPRRGEFRNKFQTAHRLLEQGAISNERKEIFARFLLDEIRFLRWDNRYSNYTRVIALGTQIVRLNVGDETSGRAQLIVAEEKEQFASYLKLTPEDVIKAYRDVVLRYPGTSSAPRAQLKIGQIFERRGNYLTALTELEMVLERWPKSDQAKRAKKLMDDIRAPRLMVNIDEVFKPDSKPYLDVRYRNLPEIEFTAHKFDLLEHVRKFRSLAYFERTVSADKIKAAANWNLQDGGEKDHKWRSSRVEVPLASSGAYLITARGRGVANRAMLLITRLANLTKNAQDEVLVYVADAISGKPVHGADLLTLSNYRYESNPILQLLTGKGKHYFFHELKEGRSDDSGLWTGTLTNERNYSPILVICRKGDDFALSQSYRYYWYAAAREETKIYTFTDRPVYRPDQEVFFKGIVRLYKDGVFNTPANRGIDVILRDAKGNEVLKKRYTTNEFGTINGSIKLDPEPALGIWQITMIIDGKSSYSTFRVEEYKKPEYEVTVTPTASQYQLGKVVKAVVNARYYFGEPVADAEVEYEIRQRQSWSYYQPVGHYDWFYERGKRPYYYYGAGAIVHKGSGKTDSEGNLVVTVPTNPLPDDSRDIKVYDFTISADVRDESRRVISGSGSTKVTSHEFSANLKTDRYVYKPGDKASVEITTRRFDGSPLATEGKLVLYRAVWNSRRHDYDYEKVWETKAATVNSGTGKSTFPTEEQGYFALRYETGDSYDQVIIGSRFVWITSSYYHSKFFNYSGVEIVPDKESYRLGETAKLLITSQLDNAVGLMTIEGEKVLSHRLVQLRQGANLIELPIVEAHEPNVFIKLNVVNGFALYSDSVELLVPPEEKFASITITPSRSEYKPGEKGTFIVEARDWRGKPLQSEFSIGVVDSSVYYIARDETPDIRKFFHGRMRGDVVRTANSFEFRFRGVETEEEAGGEAFEMKNEAPSADMAAPSGREQMVAVSGLRMQRKDADLVEAQVRKEFKDTALWLADVRTGEDGKGIVEIEWPDNLTQWRTTVRAVSTGTVVGNTTADVVTRKNLLVRLQTPRFLVQGDEVTLSVNVHNYLESDKRAKVKIEVDGLKLEGETERWLEIPAGGQSRFDVTAVAERPGTARITSSALTNEESDAMQLEIPVYIHGIEKFAGSAGSVKGQRQIELTMPEAIKAGSAELRIMVTPTVAGAMLDSLPYLINYPYGCVEQTMSRFLPAAVVAKALKNMGLERPELEKKLPAVITAGLKRLYDFQHSDGGWGWWKHDRSSPYMTSYVVFGLNLAKRAGLQVDQGRINRGVNFLNNSLKDLEDRVETLNFALFAMSWSGNVPERYLNRVFDLLPKMREYETALFAVTLNNLGKTDRYAKVMAQLEDLAKVNEKYGTVTWGNPHGWYWYQDNVEATALALMAELRRNEQSPLAQGAVQWLLSVRKGSKWKSTRDTAFAIFALSEFIKSTDEFNPDLTAVVEIDGRRVKTVHFTRENLFGKEGEILIAGDRIEPGTQRIRIVAEGKGNLYFNAFLRYFSLEEPITSASTTIAVERKYSRITRLVDGRGNEVVRRTLLKEGDVLASGDEIEVSLKLTSDNNYEYLVYEDFKPAGCEPVALVSGRTYGSLASNMELRDEKVVFFIGWLPRGEHTITYLLRAEVPGRFHTLPTNGYAMYAPDIRAISDEFIMPIRDK